eukprot:10689113-Karenia_brevis.AAC.1
MLSLSGVPVAVLTAYINYHEQVLMYNSFAGNIGAAHRHRCGIPQGCPMSMCFISLLLRPWLLQMRSLGLKARSLADDLFVTVFDRYDMTITHLHDIGGKVAPAKSTLFALHLEHRAWLS